VSFALVSRVLAMLLEYILAKCQREILWEDSNSLEMQPKLQ
jgi:hypothetical protein